MEDFTLKKKHSYRHQIQGQLHITGFTCCDLIVWNPFDVQVMRICKDPAWLPNSNQMIDLYSNEFVPSFAQNYFRNI